MGCPKQEDLPRIIILLGPTGVGKSQLAIEFAERFGGEILSADSMQVYRYMDIGTAKPSPEDRRRVKHHLIDLVNPDQYFNANLYRIYGRKIIDQLHRRGKPIWVVGGTGLYIKALTQGLFTCPQIDPEVREKLKEEAEEKGKEFLYQRLKKVDPQTASTLHPNDLFRIIRALEVYDSTGIPISFFRQQHQFGDKPYRSIKIGLEIQRDHLYDRIDQRVDRMVEQGWVGEVEGLLKMGYGPQLKSMQSLGYKQMVQFLMKKMEWNETLRQIKRDTRHYSKRQWTWFKADPEVRWFDLARDGGRISREVASFLRGG